MKNSVLALLVACLLASCSGDTPASLSLEPLDPDLAVAGASGCYTVSGTLDQTGSPDGLVGTIAGDVEGYVVTVGGPADTPGVTLSRPGEQTWEITGGIVEPLIETTLQLHVEVLAVFAQPPVFRINTEARVVEGAQRGNLTYHGTTDVSTVPITSHLDYHGVICP